MTAKKPAKAKATPKAQGKPKKRPKPSKAPEVGEARATPPKNPGGRPTDYTEDVARRLCEEIAAGESLRRICNTKDWAPAVGTVCRWLAAHEGFREQYAYAREIQADAEFDETIEIADDGRLDRTMRKDRHGNEYEVVDQDVVQRSKLMVETRLKRIALLAPKKYGTTNKLELTGKDGAPLHGKMDDSELDARIAELIRQTGTSVPLVGKSPA